MTYDTNNPLGSVDVRDLYDNAHNADNFSNGPLDAYPDRFGVSRQSLQGIRNASQYQFIGAYAAGLQFTSMNQVFSYLGEFYAPGPSIALPYTTTGAGAGEIANFRSVGDATLRSDLDADNGAELVGFLGQTVSARLLNVAYPEDYLAVGDGVADDTAAVNAALATGRPVYGSPGKVYGVTGDIALPPVTKMYGLTFKQLDPDPVARRTLFQSAGLLCQLVQVKVDRNGSGLGGQMNNSAAIYISNCADARLSECEVTGDNYGDGIVLTDSVVNVSDCYVHDMRYGDAAAVAPTDDTMQGILFIRCTGNVARNRVSNLLGQWVGQAAINRFTRGIAFGGCYDLKVSGNYVHNVDQCYDYTGGENNRRTASFGNTASTAYTWGFKSANTHTDSTFTGDIAYRCGAGSFVASAPNSDIGVTSDKLTQNITYVGCLAISTGFGNIWSGSSIQAAFGTLNSPTYPDFPRGIKWVGCTAYQGGLNKYGFRNQVPVTGTGEFYNEAINCNSAQATVANFSGMNESSMLVRMTGGQSIPSGAFTPVVINSVTEDKMNGGSTRIIRRSGLYLLTIGGDWTGNASGVRALRLLKNGANIPGATFTVVPSASASGGYGSKVVRFSAGDTVDVAAFQDTGAPLSLTGLSLEITEISKGQG